MLLEIADGLEQELEDKGVPKTEWYANKKDFSDVFNRHAKQYGQRRDFFNGLVNGIQGYINALRDVRKKLRKLENS